MAVSAADKASLAQTLSRLSLQSALSMYHSAYFPLSPSLKHDSFSVTSVGGTTGTTEVVASFTGGGFSKNFAAPSYQTSVVATYLAAQGTTYSGKFNAKGRGFPDVSAQASNYVIYNGGSAENVSGTSCATPM